MPRESKKARRERASRITERLFAAHPDAHCELVHRNAYQLLVATILSAQSTDKMVNTLTPELFQRFPNPRALDRAGVDEVEALVFKSGFYRQKTRTLLAMAHVLVEKHGARVPRTLAELVELPGVGRKTANVILGNCFDTPGIVVDTHVTRLAQRMRLTSESDAVKIERYLMDLVPEEHWTQLSHAVIFHGRRVCHARTPECEACPLPPDCPFPTQRKRKSPEKRTSARERTREPARKRTTSRKPTRKRGCRARSEVQPSEARRTRT
jgi:endonuclease-3